MLPRPEGVKQKISQTLKGRHPSSETREKMSVSAMGHPFRGPFHQSEKTKQKHRKAALKYMSIEANRQQISQSVKQLFVLNPIRRENLIERFSSAGNPSWQGGISNEPYPFEFNEELKEAVRERASRKCQSCGMDEEEHLDTYGARLSVHHTTSDKTDLDLNHFSALCKICHGSQHYIVIG